VVIRHAGQYRAGVPGRHNGRARCLPGSGTILAVFGSPQWGRRSSGRLRGRYRECPPTGFRGSARPRGGQAPGSRPEARCAGLRQRVGL